MITTLHPAPITVMITVSGAGVMACVKPTDEWVLSPTAWPTQWIALSSKVKLHGIDILTTVHAITARAKSHASSLLASLLVGAVVAAESTILGLVGAKGLNARWFPNHLPKVRLDRTIHLPGVGYGLATLVALAVDDRLHIKEVFANSTTAPGVAVFKELPLRLSLDMTASRDMTDVGVDLQEHGPIASIRFTPQRTVSHGLCS
jgi:hypothetical protein